MTADMIPASPRWFIRDRNCTAMIPAYGDDALVCLYVKDLRSGEILEGPKEQLRKGEWKELEFAIPAMEGALLGEMGFCFHVQGVHTQVYDFTGKIDDQYVNGTPDYSI